MKQKILSMLLKRGIVSGEEMAKELGVSRAAIWKSMKQLQKEGFAITARQNRGYTLENAAPYHPYAIEAMLDTKKVGKAIQFYDRLDSTNTFLENTSQRQDGLCVIAKEQSNGKGRMGRGFYSPKDQGLYFSILFLPEGLTYHRLYLLIDTICLAVAKAIEEVCQVKTKIRWPGDVYVGGRKVCGMLHECRMEIGSGDISRLISGIGIHVNKQTFPKELQPSLTSLAQETGKEINKNDLMTTILFYLDEYYVACRYQRTETLADYKDHLDFLCQNVWYRRGGVPDERVTLLDVNDQGGLILQRKDKSILVAYQGELKAC